MDLDMAILTNQPDADALCRWTLEEYQIPEALREGLVRYLVGRIRPGSFLSAVLENNLAEAAVRANPPENLAALPSLVRFLYNETPSSCWGSDDKVVAWLRETARTVRITGGVGGV